MADDFDLFAYIWKLQNDWVEWEAEITRHDRKQSMKPKPPPPQVWWETGQDEEAQTLRGAIRQIFLDVFRGTPTS